MIKLLIEVLAAAIGTAAFSVLFQVRPKHYVFCALAGGIAWFAYRVITALSGSVFLATFLSALILNLCCRWFATLRHAPTLVFLLCGIFPLFPVRRSTTLHSISSSTKGRKPLTMRR